MLQGKYDQAEPLFKRALAIDENFYGDDKPEVATILADWASSMTEQVKSVSLLSAGVRMFFAYSALVSCRSCSPHISYFPTLLSTGCCWLGAIVRLCVTPTLRMPGAYGRFSYVQPEAVLRCAVGSIRHPQTPAGKVQRGHATLGEGFGNPQGGTGE